VNILQGQKNLKKQPNATSQTPIKAKASRDQNKQKERNNKNNGQN
jgi:hypothetical protein